MPDRGLRSFEHLPLPEIGRSSPLTLPRAAMLQLTFEVDRDTALSYLPCAVSRPIPTYARFLFVDSADLRFHVASVGGRYRMLPRNVVISALSPGNVLAPTFGEGSEAGASLLERDDGHIEASAAASGDSFSATIETLSAIEPSMLRWDPYLVAGRGGAGPELAEVTLTLDLERAYLGKSVRMSSQVTSNENAWRRLRSFGLISACYVEGALTLSSPETQESLA